MYKNVGKKIQTLILIIVIVEIILSVLAGIMLLISDMIISGILFLIISPLVVWISGFFLYGFGEIIVKLNQIAQNTKEISVMTYQNYRYNISKDNNLNDNIPKSSFVDSDNSENYAKHSHTYWKCKKCGAENPYYVNKCSCGSYFFESD